MKALLVLFSVLLILLLAGLWVGNGSYPDRWRLENEIKLQEQSNKLQKEKNRQIQAELDDVAAGDDAIEERARSELGMTRKDETFFEIILQPQLKNDDKHATVLKIGEALPDETERDKKPVKKLENNKQDSSATTSQATNQDENNDD